MSSEIEYITSAENAAEKMRAMGFTDARVTGPGADGGIDVWSRKAVAQVKWRSAQTGRPELQQLYGARAGDHDQRLLFFTASGYSQAAIEYAKAVKMALFTYDPLGELTPRNKRARKLLAAPVSTDESSASASTGEPFKVAPAPKSSAPSGGGAAQTGDGALDALVFAGCAVTDRAVPVVDRDNPPGEGSH
ncbi:restriction endonuclease [Rhodococcus rhodochrous]|uniref:restriction endonuclease n=1 Tax=Rhodococcus rhodochrous TaxID=1829 RepID=UPI0032DEAC71